MHELPRDQAERLFRLIIRTLRESARARGDAANVSALAPELEDELVREAMRRRAAARRPEGP